MNNNGKPRKAPSDQDPASGVEIDWNFYRRFLYEIWEEKSLASLSDADSSFSELSSESLELPLGFGYPATVLYSAKTNQFSPISRITKNSGQNSLVTPRPLEEMANFQGDTTREKNTTEERSGVMGSHFADAFITPSECCSQCKEQRTIPRVAPQSLQFGRNEQSVNPRINYKSDVYVGQKYNSRNAPISAYGHTYPQCPRNISPQIGDSGLGYSLGNTRGNIDLSLNPEDGARRRDIEECNRHVSHKTDTNLFIISEASDTKPEETFGVNLQKKRDSIVQLEENTKLKPSACVDVDILGGREDYSTRNKKSFETNKSKLNMCICGEEIERLRKELQDSKNQIMALSMQMGDQSHLQQLIEERRRTQQRKSCRSKAQNSNLSSFPLGEFNADRPLHPPTENPCRGYPPYDSHSLFTPHRGRDDFSSIPYSDYNNSSNITNKCARGHGRGVSDRDRVHQGMSPNLISELSRDPNVLATLNERNLALQLQNIHLNVFLKKEEERRQEVEADLEKERNYIKKLEDNIQDMRSSRVVMDPHTYKEVADSYIAARRQPVRRTHTCMPCIGQSDLVCDLKGQDHLTVHYPHSSKSCPSSPLGSKTGKKKAVASQQQFSSLDDTSSLVSESPELGANLLSPWANASTPGSGPSLDQEEYLKLLESFEKLDSSPS